jgi:DNA-binding NarL/FixJ family response regulator
MRPRVLLADNDQDIRRTLKALLAGEGIELAGEACDTTEALELARTLQPDVTVMGLAVPAACLIEIAREVLRACPETDVIVVAADADLVVKAFQSGVRGYLVRSGVTEELARAIDEVSRGRIFVSPRAARAVIGERL